MKTVTMRDIAKQLNISIVTVSNALSNKNGVSDEIRNQVIETADRMGYTVNKCIKSREDNTVCIIISERYLGKYESFYWSVYHKLSKKLDKANYFGILEVLSIESEKALIPPSVLSSNKGCGVIVLGQVSEKYLQLLNEFSKPMILLDFYNEDNCYDTITTTIFLPIV